MKDYIGETLNQPLYILLRVFECNSVPGATPPASPGNGQTNGLVLGKEQESWTLIYEAPPVCLTDFEGRVLDDHVIAFDDDSKFHYKHPYNPAPSTLFEPQEAGNHEPSAAYPCCPSPLSGIVAPPEDCVQQRAVMYQMLAMYNRRMPQKVAVRAPPAGPWSRARAIQAITATVMQPFQVVPEVSLEVVLPDGAESKCTFPLPLVITQFMRPVTLSPAAFMQLWFDGALHSRLMGVRLSSRLRSGGLSELMKVVTFNGKFRATDGIKHRLAENSIFSIGELPAIGDMPSDCRCMIRVWHGPFGAASMAKLEVKAEDQRVAAAVFELLAYAIEDGE
ncbi:conserved hypothetical protein [Neospora caninum Liverpool]|uniref:Uncharacterized protein n=1 Tax=Neospora caninum (strain Liverpool) TaxID=572307 RepID=F0VK99_NEOCL|nr:conserved hypothetical protein [Neospora caninum Liverpool]CBZ54500.1 conserved hypothetical protein [Neospora caninum Liverpool]|eukprot:XP_003884530.1 conserved hypothetical protein [Neospora caninum Liverpool]